MSGYNPRELDLSPRELGALDLDALPPRWQDLWPQRDFVVPCGDSTHTVRWTPEGGAVALDHNRTATRVVGALGGPASTCEQLAAIANAGLEGDGRLSMTPAGEVALPLSLHPFTAVFGTTADRTNEQRQALVGFSIRASESASIRFVAEAVGIGWLEHLGADVDGASAVVKVFSDRAIHNPIHNPDDDADDFIPQDAFLFANWGPGIATRMAMGVDSSWYANIVANGWMVDGRINMGHNGIHPVVGHVERGEDGLCEAYGIATVPGRELSAYRSGEFASVETLSATPTGRMFVVGHNVIDHNDESYYLSDDGMSPVGVVSSEQNARAWVDFTNVTEMFISGLVSLDEWGDYFDSNTVSKEEAANLPSATVLVSVDDFDVMSGTTVELAARLAEEGRSPTTFHIPASDYRQVSDLT